MLGKCRNLLIGIRREVVCVYVCVSSDIYVEGGVLTALMKQKCIRNDSHRTSYGYHVCTTTFRIMLLTRYFLSIGPSLMSVRFLELDYVEGRKDTKGPNAQRSINRRRSTISAV